MAKSPRRQSAFLLPTGDTANGVFIRHQMGDYPGNNGGAFSACPDIVISVDGNNNPAPLNPTTVISQQGYYTEFNPGGYVYQGNVNYVYLRALNNASSLSPPPQFNPRLWLFYTVANLALWPANWQSNNIQVQGQAGQQNWQDTANLITSTITGQGGQSGQQLNLLATSEPFLWNPPVLGGGNHYCLMVMAENPLSDPPSPPLPGPFQTFADLCAFVLTNDWIGWRNVVGVQRTVPTWEMLFPVAGPPQTSNVEIGVQCTNMPVGSAFSFSVAGPDGTTNPGDGVSSGMVTIKNPNQSYYMPMVFPANFDTTMVLIWYANGTTPAPGAEFTVFLALTQNAVMPLLSDRTPIRRGTWGWNLSGGHWTILHPFGAMTVVFV
jgi:hypothetical protein